MRRLVFVLALVPMLAAGVASADFSGSGSGFAFPDNDPAGASSDIVVSLAPNEIISDVSVTLTGLSHTWVGDLNASLIGPGGTIDLMFRTGDAQGDCCGDSSDLGGDYTFADGGADWWAAAASAGGADIIPGGTYAPTTILGAPQSFAGTFGGTTTNGTWTLQISDEAGGDLGSLGSWTLNITSVVPEPSSLAVLGLAGLGMLYRRRR